MAHPRVPVLLGSSPLVFLAVLACNQAPTGPEITVEPDAPTTLDDLVVSVTREASDPNDDVLATRYTWSVKEPAGPDEFAVRSDFIGDTVSSTATAKGQIWRVEVAVSDGTEAAPEVASAEVAIRNTPPEVTALAVTPTKGVDTLGTLTATTAGSDIDGDTVTVDITWYVDGVALEMDGRSLTGEHFGKGQSVWAEATARDGEDAGEPVASEPVVIVNTPPRAEGAVIAPEMAFEESTLTCQLTGWWDADDDAPNADVVWYVNGAEVATTPELTGASFDKGDLVRCRATPNDGDDLGTPVVSPVAAIGNTPPVVGSVVIDATAPQAVDSLTFTLVDAADADGDAITTRAEWYVDGTRVHEGDVLPPRSFVKGQDIHVVVTPFDGEQYGEPVESGHVTGANSPPRITDVAMLPSDVFTDSVVFPSVTAEDVDGDRLTYARTWYVNGTAVAETASTLDGNVWFDKGDEIYVELTPNDGDADGATFTSEVVEVLNSPPTTPVIAIDPEEPRSTDDLWCYLDVAPTDADGDDLEYTFAWTRNGSAFTDADTLEYDGDYIHTEDTADLDDWVCTLTVTDGTATVSAEVLAEVRDWAGPRTFTDCGRSGYSGPTTCTSAYAGTNLDGKVTLDKGWQLWEVPQDGTFRLEAWGAQGGKGLYGSNAGGRGARVRGDFSLKKGDTLYIAVGQMGQRGSGSYAAGGGGATWIYKNGRSDGNLLMVAGGGGGNGYDFYSASGCDGQSGSLARTGGNSFWSSCGTSFRSSGFGGTYFYRRSGSFNYYYGGGGTGSRFDGVAYYSNQRAYDPLDSSRPAQGGDGSWSDGGFGGGGMGGHIYSYWWGTFTSSSYGSGGGGGLVGGDGGYYRGGGGSSYNAGSSQSNSTGAQSGDGQVVVDLAP